MLHGHGRSHVRRPVHPQDGPVDGLESGQNLVHHRRHLYQGQGHPVSPGQGRSLPAGGRKRQTALQGAILGQRRRGGEMAEYLRQEAMKADRYFIDKLIC